MTIGTFTRKTEPHQKWASSMPPLIGPMPMPSADTPAQMPMAVPRSSRLGEHVGEDRQRGRHDERAADAHQRAGRDRARRHRWRTRTAASRCRRRQAERERPVAAEPVTEAARGEQQAGEHERVGVDDPLQLAARRAEPALLHRVRERRQGDVEDRVVEHDHDQAHAQHEQREPAAVVHVLGIPQPCAHSSSQTRNGTVPYLSGRMRDGNLAAATISGMADEELVFERTQWATLRASTPLELDDDDLAELRGINERLDLDEVAEIYLPLVPIAQPARRRHA